MLDRLRSTPRRDPRLARRRSPTTRSSPGDLLKLRVLDRATGRFRVVPFHVVGSRAGVPLGAEGLVHGREPRLPRGGRARRRARTSSSPRPSGDPAAVAQRVARSDELATAQPSRTSASRPPDGQLDHDGRPHRHQPDRGASSRSLLAAAAMALFVGARRSPSAGRSSRRWPRSARSLRQIGAFLWSEAALVLGAGARAGRGARLAARRDARRDAPARLRPAARPARDPLGLPRRAGGRSDRRRGRRHRARRRQIRRLPLGEILREQ